ncbi:DUF4294 domain-containing protein [Pseudofulvibacter geojedonensis]|uniref:DUF4294 domain-containing protein n=1 Tax=Pseudofulvibacter geojedonensis TaxID=1123758 RepID=A0ABW3HZV7_9FLAO
MRYIPYIYIMLFSILSFSQNESIEEKDTLNKEVFIVKGDSIYNHAVNLDDVVVLKKIRFADKQDRIKYLILRRKVRKVYPYAKMAADKLTELNEELKHIKGKRAKKRYTKKVQKYIEEEFSAKLKKFTRTEGQILIKLIHRQTGKTAFALVKELRSGWRAFWYNSTANMFSISLKEEYSPSTSHEDFYIEDILMRSFMDGVLEKQPHALDYDYFELSDKWFDKTTK